ncbi:hypothetical protein GCM10027296_21840 [Chitinimonas naiadis]
MTPRQIENQVETHRIAGDRAYHVKDWQGALTSCKSGLEVLGANYYDPAILIEDDTGQKLMAGWTEEHEGRISNAATLYCRMLKVRLQLYQDRTARQKDLSGK